MGCLFGKKLYELRKAKGLTLEDLAEQIESSKGYLSSIENFSKPAPSDKIVAKLARLLGIKRKILLRLAHIDNIAEDIQQELRASSIITPQKIAQQAGQDLSSLLRESLPGYKPKSEAPFPVGHIPILEMPSVGMAGLPDLKALWDYTHSFFQFSIPGISVSFALRMSDDSMESKQGTAFRKGSLVLFASVKRIHAGDNLLVVYRTENGVNTVFRHLQRYHRRRLYLSPLNRQYRKEMVLPRSLAEKIWKAVASLQIFQ